MNNFTLVRNYRLGYATGPFLYAKYHEEESKKEQTEVFFDAVKVTAECTLACFIQE